MARTANNLARQLKESGEKGYQPAQRREVAANQEQAESPVNHQRIAIVGTLVDTMLGFRGELIREMVTAGHTVFAFATDYTKETRAAIREMGAEPVLYRMGQVSTNPLGDIAAVWQLYRLFKRHNISLSFCYFSKPSIYGTIAAKMAGVPFRVAKIEGLGRIFTVGPKGDSFRKRFVRKLMIRLFRFSLPMAHRLLVLNQGDKEDLESFGIRSPEPEMLGGIGVCLERYSFRPPITDPVRFIFIGRLLHEKGVRYYIEAARALRRSYPKTEFILLGAPDAKPGAINRDELKQLVEEGLIIYPGLVKDVVPWLADSSVFVLPTYYREGVPRSTQEALAMGRPVITTSMPGCRKTVVEGENGFLVPPHNQAALEKAMLRFIQEPELIRPMGLASYHLARERFDVREINKTIFRLLDLNPVHLK
ncbi:glycosyltransferase family 4 protein [Marinobacter sp. ATCH36]|uniref:glycosyltransferase family 4 protein n=1 Tax=Marinobacter sp. ATCH36 TaxID=2945106 RepID=UPI002021518B|nr:glycosyltransferase family 4 protein [Marinobacter sp. ATCH36]MCL7945148.1 glycosyltransferase family 4 protein [Marinobacter sp. ATCH36]